MVNLSVIQQYPKSVTTNFATLLGQQVPQHDVEDPTGKLISTWAQVDPNAMNSFDLKHFYVIK
jgi:hypothetical protein